MIELQFLSPCNVGNVTSFERRMNLPNQKLVLMRLPADKQRLAVLSVAGNKCIDRNITVATRDPVVGWSTNEDFKLSFPVSFIAPRYIQSTLRSHDAA